MIRQVELPPEPSSVAAGRVFLRGTLQTWQLDGLGGDAELMLSELVTNAVLHARTEISVQVSVLGRSGTALLHVGVHDESPRPPRRVRYSDQATTGRGLGIVEALADDHGVSTSDSGKVVWFELTVPLDWEGDPEQLAQEAG